MSCFLGLRHSEGGVGRASQTPSPAPEELSPRMSAGKGATGEAGPKGGGHEGTAKLLPPSLPPSGVSHLPPRSSQHFHLTRGGSGGGQFQGLSRRFWLKPSSSLALPLTPPPKKPPHVFPSKRRGWQASGTPSYPLLLCIKQ